MLQDPITSIDPDNALESNDENMDLAGEATSDSSDDPNSGTTVEVSPTLVEKTVEESNDGEPLSFGQLPPVPTQGDNTVETLTISNNGTGDAGSAEEIETVTLANTAPAAPVENQTLAAAAPIEVAGSGVTKIEIPDAANAVSVAILTKPEHGNLTINPDNSLSLVMTGQDYTGTLDFSYEVTYADNSKSVVSSSANVTAPEQAAGWGEGDFYMLETDSSDNLIVETGESHRKVYVSNSSDALSIADIAALEGIEPESITTLWLTNRAHYGSSEDNPLKVDAAMMLWKGITGRDVEPNSNWLLFERGYEYENTGYVVTRGTQGESELNPVHITAWGEGDRPVLHDKFGFFQETVSNLVVSNLVLAEGTNIIGGNNLIMDDVAVTGDELNAQKLNGFTFRNGEIHDIYRDAPRNLSEGWSAASDRISGAYISQTDGLLLEGNIVENNGFRAGYDQVTGATALEYQPPSQYNHNLYLQFNTRDVTVRDNIISQAASTGLQARGGAFIEDNMFIDNNVAFNVLGGNYENRGPVGNFSLVNNNIVTEAGHKQADAIGAISWGISNEALGTNFIDNMIVHLADPNDPEALAAATVQGMDLIRNYAPNFDNTTVYNWVTGDNVHKIDDWAQNLAEGADPAKMFQATIQNYAAQVTGDPNATISSLMDFLRNQANGAFDDVGEADLMVAFFKAGFGFTTSQVSNAGNEPIRFVPNELGDGVRWDNRLNWASDEVPGMTAADNVDLGGNWVNYGGTNTINVLDFGDGGRLNVEHGKLTVNSGFKSAGSEARLTIDDAGQVWTNGFDPAENLMIGVNGGRFANFGTFKGEIKLAATDGQVLFGAGSGIFETTKGSHIAIVGSDVKVGFDDTDNSDMALRLGRDSTLSLIADEEGFSTIGEFRSGAFGDSPDTNFGINLGRSDLNLDLTALQGQQGFHKLMKADAIIGEFANVNVFGLADDQNYRLRIDHEGDRVTLWMSEAGAGTGSFKINTVGSQINTKGTGLWGELTSDFGKGIWKASTDLDVVDGDFNNDLSGLMF